MIDPYINKETINKSRNLEPEPDPSVADMSDVETDPKGRGRGKDRGRSRVRREAQLGAAARSGSKRARHSSADEEEIDTDVVLVPAILDSTSGSKSKRFINLSSKESSRLKQPSRVSRIFFSPVDKRYYFFLSP